jgi:PAS domain-containing protein
LRHLSGNVPFADEIRLGLIDAAIPFVDALERMGTDPEDLDRLRRRLDANDEFREEELRLVDKAGSETRLEVSGRPIAGAKGRPAGVLGSARDVTERHRIAEELRESEHRYRVIAETTSDYVCEYRRESGNRFRLIWSAGSFQDETIRFEPYIEFGKFGPLGDRYYPDEMDQVKQRFKDTAAGRLIQTEMRVRRGDGSCAWVLLSARGDVDPETGEVVGFVGAIKDISERHRIAAELRDSEHRYRIIAEMTSDFICSYVKESGNRYRLNFSAGSFSDDTVRFEPLVEFGKTGPFGDRYHSDEFGLLQQRFADLKKGRLSAAEMRVRKKDGDYIWVHLTSRGVLDPETGELVVFVGAIKDIDERKRIAAELETSEHRYRVITEMTSDLIYTYSRETETRSRLQWSAGSLFGETFNLAPVIEVGVQAAFGDRYHPSEVDHIRAHCNEVFIDRPSTLELRVRKADGSYVWVFVS